MMHLVFDETTEMKSVLNDDVPLFGNLEANTRILDY